jgi:crossover junction endodeoxyribonuclease RusA
MTAETVAQPWDGQPFTIRLPFTDPPLRANDRLSWPAEARVKKSIRQAARLMARNWPLAPIDRPCHVMLVWEVTDRRVRDANSGTPTCKAAVDGLVDAGVFVSDRHEIVTGQDCRVELGTAKGLRLDVTAA